MKLLQLQILWEENKPPSRCGDQILTKINSNKILIVYKIDTTIEVVFPQVMLPFIDFLLHADYNVLFLNSNDLCE